MGGVGRSPTGKGRENPREMATKGGAVAKNRRGTGGNAEVPWVPAGREGTDAPEQEQLETVWRAAEPDRDGDGEEDSCGKCKQKIKGGDSGLQCEKCERWFHAGCAGVSAELYRVLEKYSEQLWFCKTCRGQIKTTIDRLKGRNKTLEQKVFLELVIMREVYNALPDDRPITSLCVVEEVAKCPINYTAVSRTHDQDVDADLYKDGFFRRVTRYLCHSKTEGYLGYVVEQLVVVPDRESCPPGFTPLITTMDTNQKAFKKKQICFKALSKTMAKQIVTDIIVLSNSKVAPEGFSLAGELNGMCVCYKLGPTPSPASPVGAPLPYQMGPHAGRSGSQCSLYPGLERPSRPAPAPPYTSPVHQPRAGGGDVYEPVNSALFGLPFLLNKKYVDCSNGAASRPLPTVTPKRSSMIQSEYYYSFSLEQDVLQRPSS